MCAAKNDLFSVYGNGQISMLVTFRRLSVYVATIHNNNNNNNQIAHIHATYKKIHVDTYMRMKYDCDMNFGI